MGLRVAFLPEYFLPHLGGIELWTYHVARELGRRGHDVYIVTYRVPGFPKVHYLNDLKIVRVGSIPVSRHYSYLVRAISYLTGLRELMSIKADVYLASYSLSSLSPKLFKGRDVYAVWHGYYGLRHSLASKGWVRGITRYFVQSLALRAEVKGIIAVSNYLKCLLKGVLNGIGRSINISVAYCGVDLKLIDSVKVRVREPWIIFMGRMVYEKQPHHALRAFAKVSNEVREAKLLFVGDGPLINALRGMALRLGLRDKVIFAGRVTGRERFKLLKRSKALVLPSVSEGFPIAPLESLACRTPFIAYDIPPLKEEYLETRGGILVPTNDVRGLSEAIISILEDENLARRLAEEGRRNVEEKFTWDKVAERVEEAIGLN